MVLNLQNLRALEGPSTYLLTGQQRSIQNIPTITKRVFLYGIQVTRRSGCFILKDVREI
jgi:hypothetical protein